METGNTVLVVWCEDTNEWGIVNGRSNKTWQKFPDTTVGIRDCIKAIHAIGYDAEILQGGGVKKTFHYVPNDDLCNKEMALPYTRGKD